jgi:YtcA-like protein
VTARRDAGGAIRPLLLFFITPLLLSCSRAPAVDVLGSFFPSWLFCFVVAIVLTAFVRLGLQRLHVQIAFPILVYPSLAAFFTFALWLIFFY